MVRLCICLIFLLVEYMRVYLVLHINTKNYFIDEKYEKIELTKKVLE